jgi:hypothetical protein
MRLFWVGTTGLPFSRRQADGKRSSLTRDNDVRTISTHLWCILMDHSEKQQQSPFPSSQRNRCGTPGINDWGLFLSEREIIDYSNTQSQTPLNNNLRELFNLMNFIDPEGWNNLEQLERQYRQEHLTKELLSELHLKLKEYFLRRTKEILKLPNKVF